MIIDTLVTKIAATLQRDVNDLLVAIERKDTDDVKQHIKRIHKLANMLNYYVFK